MNKFTKLLNEALDEIGQRIPLEQCYQEDEGLFCYASPQDMEQNSGAMIVYASKQQLERLYKESPSSFNIDKLKSAKPDENGLYYLPDVYV